MDENGSEIGAVYRERACLVALLARLYASLLSYNDPAEPDWAVLYIETPAGQLSWHIAPEDIELFGHVRQVAPNQVRWDGHSTAEKYERVRQLAAGER